MTIVLQNYLRSTTSGVRLTNLTFLSIERELTDKIDFDDEMSTLLLIHLLLRNRISPHHSHHLHSHHLSLPQPFTPDLKLISFTNPFLHSLLISSGLPSRILNLY